MSNSETWDKPGDSQRPALSTPLAYAIAAASVAIAFLLRLALDPLWGSSLPFATFFLAVLVVTQLAGPGPSVFTIIAGFLLADWFFAEPRHSLAISTPVNQFNAAGYFILCLGALFFSVRLRGMLARERSARAVLTKLSAIIESSDDAIIGKSLDGKIISWNGGATRLFGYSEAEAIGQPLENLVEPGHWKELSALCDRVAAGEHINHLETVQLRKGGGRVDVSISICPVLNNAGKVVGVSIISRDITDRKRAEYERERLVAELREEVSERKEAQKALQESHEITMRQDRMAAVGRLAAGLAHEFNNILTIIQGHASLLLDNPKMDEDALKSVHHISEGVERTAALVKQMLAFSRKRVMQQKIVLVSEVVNQIKDVLTRLLGAQNSLRSDFSPTLPPILADPEMLQQIIVNLVVNARDAMTGDGQVTIRASETTVTDADLAGKPDRRTGRFVKLSVQDTGCGIEAKIIGHLFEPFFTTKEIGKGVGLGLATVHGMVSQNSGWIEVESTVGEGTRFHIYFPAVEKPAQKRTMAPGTTQRGAGETVLVVEDEDVLRELVQDILQASGYRVLSAATGREALQLWDKNSEDIKLVLTDMSMPDGMSGRELATQLQARRPGLPVIFSSGYVQEAERAREDANSSTVFLSKPYHPADLAKAVRTALDNSSRKGASLAPRNGQA